MKRFLLFVGDTPASGGWHEYIGAFDSLREAVAKVPPEVLTKETGLPVSWAHIVDLRSQNIIRGYGNDVFAD